MTHYSTWPPNGKLFLNPSDSPDPVFPLAPDITDLDYCSLIDGAIVVDPAKLPQDAEVEE